MKVVPRIETPPLEAERRSLAEYQAIVEAVKDHDRSHLHRGPAPPGKAQANPGADGAGPAE